jgi:hypothetical protein
MTYPDSSTYILNFCPSYCILIVRKPVRKEAAMLVIPGIFKDNTFIPEKTLDLPDGSRGRFTVDEQSTLAKPPLSVYKIRII